MDKTPPDPLPNAVQRKERQLTVTTTLVSFQKRKNGYKKSDRNSDSVAQRLRHIEIFGGKGRREGGAQLSSAVRVGLCQRVRAAESARAEKRIARRDARRCGASNEPRVIRALLLGHCYCY